MSQLLQPNTLSFLSACLIFLHSCVHFDTTTGRTTQPGCSRAHEICALRLAFLRSILCLAFWCAMRVAKGWERNRQELYVANRPAGYVQRIAASLSLFLFTSLPIWHLANLTFERERFRNPVPEGSDSAGRPGDDLDNSMPVVWRWAALGGRSRSACAWTRSNITNAARS